LCKSSRATLGATKSKLRGADDDAALAFGKQLIRELMREYGEHHLGSTMDITEGDRTIGSIPFKFEVGQD
jgi:hypothetical protein